MNRSQLDAESVRDAVLQVTGKLDPHDGRAFGQAVHSKPKGLHVTPIVDYLNFNPSTALRKAIAAASTGFCSAPCPTRSWIRWTVPDASQLTPKRNTSVTAKARRLAMLNNRFIVRQSEHFAERVAKVSGDPGRADRRSVSTGTGPGARRLKN